MRRNSKLSERKPEKPVLHFSLVIPNFNQSHFLPFALEGLRYQSVPVRLAIMDGGSTDNFPDVLKKYADIVTYSRSAPDNGQAAAIREGFQRVPGEIVSWLNADDYLFPGALERVAAAFEADPLLDVVYGDAIHVSKEGLFLSYFPPIQEFDANDLTRTCFICQPACFLRRSAYEKVGGVDPSLVYTMDWDLWCRLARAGAKFQHLPEPLAAVRYYPGTKTLSGDRRRYGEIWRIERTYGRRMLPWSWGGFYFFDLSFKEHKTAPERAAFTVLKSMRRVKKRLFTSQDRNNRISETLYGFHRWEPLVVGKGTVRFPWYDRRRLDKICLRVAPYGGRYRTAVNHADPAVLSAKGGEITLDMPILDNPGVEISIECLDQRCWALLEFSGELTSATQRSGSE